MIDLLKAVLLKFMSVSYMMLCQWLNGSWHLKRSQGLYLRGSSRLTLL